jgi:poly(A) polymerase
LIYLKKTTTELMLAQTIKAIVNKVFKPLGLAQGAAKRYHVKSHRIDKRLVSRNAVKVCEVLQQKGFDAYIVGGAVRDLMIGLEPKDFDVATNATPDQIRPLFRRARIIGRRFQLVHVVFGSEIIETSTFRAPAHAAQSTDDHGRILRDNDFGSHPQDAARRDFTINALYYNPVNEEVIDFHQGVPDLNKRVVRIIGNPQLRYREDPVRMLRAVRFAVKLNGSIETESRKPIKSMADLIDNVPASRLFDEMLKLLTCGHALECLKQLRTNGLHQGLLPLLDVVLEQPSGAAFVQLALDRTDHRVRSGKPVSPSFLFAALLWQQVELRWREQVAAGVISMHALVSAADTVIDMQTEKLAIHRRFTSDMRDIWFMQPRFEKRVPRMIHRLIEQPRFRAAVDFLQLRAAAHDFDSVLAQWWMDLANASEEKRHDMIEDLANLPPSNQDRAPRKRRPRKRKPALSDTPLSPQNPSDQPLA